MLYRSLRGFSLCWIKLLVDPDMTKAELVTPNSQSGNEVPEKLMERRFNSN